jgi:hypothetical protein
MKKILWRIFQPIAFVLLLVAAVLLVADSEEKFDDWKEF